MTTATRRRTQLPPRLRRAARHPDPRPVAGWKTGTYDGPTEHRDRREEARYLAAGLVPALYARNPAACHSLLLKAQSLNIPVAVAFENVHWNRNIGKGAISAQLMAALLRRHNYDHKTTREDDQAVTMVFYRIVDGRRRRLGEATWTMLETVGAGLAWRSCWQHYPTDMLWARCLMRGARRYASEVGTGMAYTLEELHDMAADDEGTAPSAELQALLDQATSADTTPEQIKNDIVVRAKAAKLLDADLGDGTTLGYVLGMLWAERRAQQVDQLQRQALADERSTPAPAAAGSGPLACGCPSGQVIATGAHVEEVCSAR